ncbi:MAG: ATP-binding cassette domain-containing protein, partial [Muribaculaceae bacterium]|nr:ATP-binding cassette domain-containing protein [Muribaculaceae bacterium]
MSKLITLDHVGMRWDTRTVLTDITLQINRGDFVAITGPNGGGKTTLLKIILKLLRPTCGSVDYWDEQGGLLSRLSIGYLPQKNMIDSHFPIDVRQVIASGLLGVKMDNETKSELVEAMIDQVGLRAHSGSPIGDLSGGQLQRALLGRALISDPSVIVLDEPLSYLDKHFEHRIYDIIGELAPGHTIICVSHEVSAIAEMANRHWIVDHTIHECTAAHHFMRLSC